LKKNQRQFATIATIAQIASLLPRDTMRLIPGQRCAGRGRLRLPHAFDPDNSGSSGA
jgi:hypothetical protein